MSGFYVGQEVVFIDGSGRVATIYGDEAIPSVGAHYTIREIVQTPGIEDCCTLAEIVNPPHKYRYWPEARECVFGLSRFRPIKSESIQIFREMCRTVKRNIDA